MKGLYQRPTVINNVETLANVVNIVRDGAKSFRDHGTAKNPGTRLISISGHIAQARRVRDRDRLPVAEVPDEDCGGMMNGAKLKCVIPGGISTKVLTAADIARLTLDSESVEAPARRWARAA